MQNLHGLVLFICLICYTASPLCWEASLPTAGGRDQAICEPLTPSARPKPPQPRPTRPAPHGAALPFPALPGRGAGRARGRRRPKMAEYVQVAKRALKHLSGHGGVRGAIWQLLR